MPVAEPSSFARSSTPPTALLTASELKRKRSPSHNVPLQHGLPPAKHPKTHNHLQINYLARQNKEDLALASAQDTMPEIIDLLSQYHGVLERHESLACNLGARPLGPILIKRFERLFDAPPKVLKSHGKDCANVSWLDVVEFARNKPDQFKLGQMSEGLNVCQFYTKQCRVQISEEDFVLIDSGMPQKLIPPQPIMEDEEKELGTLEILEERLTKICHLADQVAARTRLLNHRIKGRKQAILDRRANEPAVSVRPTSPSNVGMINGNPGFVAVNARPAESNGAEHGKGGASAQTRQELMDRFSTLTERRTSAVTVKANAGQPRGSVAPNQVPASIGIAAGPDAELAALLLSNNAVAQSPHIAPVTLPTTPSALQYHHHTTGSPEMAHLTLATAAGPSAAKTVEKEKPDDGPFKFEMVSRLESLGKGDRILPPCDRCRRLHMDCLKNLTACQGCTKKHAKCSWRDVKEDEMLSLPPIGCEELTYGDDAAMHSPEYEAGGEYSQALSRSSSAAGVPPYGTSCGYQFHAAESEEHEGGRENVGFAEAEAALMAVDQARTRDDEAPTPQPSDRYYMDADSSGREQGIRYSHADAHGNARGGSATSGFERDLQFRHDHDDLHRHALGHATASVHEIDSLDSAVVRETPEDLLQSRLLRAVQGNESPKHSPPAQMHAATRKTLVDAVPVAPMYQAVVGSK